MRKVLITTGMIANEVERAIGKIPVVTIIGGLELSITLGDRTVRREIRNQDLRLSLNDFTANVLSSMLKEIK